jgi:hypothetical protein
MRAAAWQTGMCLPSFLPSMGAVYIEQVLRAYGAFQRSTYHTPSGQSRGLGAATHRSKITLKSSGTTSKSLMSLSCAWLNVSLSVATV